MSKKISQLTTTTTLADTDVLPVVTGMTGTPAGKKIAVSNLKTAVNYHTHANQSALDSVSGVNTGDQNLSSYLTSATAASTYEPLKGADDNFVTDAEKVVIGNTSGTNTGDQTLPVKATGAEITTGTDDAKFATAKALADAGVNTRLKSKLISATRDMTAATGDVNYTGVGFQPTAIMAIATTGTSGAAPAIPAALGFADSAGGEVAINTAVTASFCIEGSYLLLLYTTNTSTFQHVVLKNFGVDGFTLTWTKGGSPTGTANLAFLCFR